MSRFLPLFLLAAACGGDDNPTQPDAPPTADGPAQADARPDAMEPDAGPATGEGLVIASEQLTADGAAAVVSVTLNDGPLFGGPTGTSAGCGLYGMPPNTGMSAGVITVTGTTAPVTVTPSQPTPPVEYDDGSPPLNLFEPGATITMTAAGQAGGVPAFSGTVIAPDPLAAVTLPTTVSRAAPPILTWTAGTADEMWVWIIALNGAGADLLFCRGPDTGSYTFTTEALALVPNADTQGIVVLWRTNFTPVTAGPTVVALTAADAIGTDLISIEP